MTTITRSRPLLCGWRASQHSGVVYFSFGFRAGASAVGQGAVEEGEQAVPVALQCGGLKASPGYPATVATWSGWAVAVRIAKAAPMQ
ncbi:hypothetical protein DY245_04075 [Streptomyces inhibens]|uniref:Uncharacterized protein n=1 Tax=Streptomyces inhibens TaxID=2293571 RepID=A0A371QA02_STRIH|nr:hypothetical protein DY245_04075 [Streptomyces inhibens]